MKQHYLGATDINSKVPMFSKMFFVFLIFATPIISVNCSAESKNAFDGCVREAKSLTAPDIRRAAMDSNAVINFYCRMKSAIIDNDKAELTDMVQFPIDACVGDREMVIKNKNEFLKYYNQIINENVRKIIENQKYSDLMGKWYGVGLDGGAIWFDKDETYTAKIFIVAINNNMYCKSTLKRGNDILEEAKVK